MPTDSVVDTLFGPQPWQIQQQQNQRMQDFAHQQAGMNAAQRSVQAMTNAGGLLGGVAMEGMGYVNPAVAQAQQRQAIMSMPGDLTTAAGLKAKAAQFAQAGDQATALKLVMLAKKQEAEEQKQLIEQRKQILGERKQEFQEQDAMDFKRQQLQQAYELKKQQLSDARLTAIEKAEIAKQMLDLKREMVNPSAKPLPPKALQMQADALEAMNIASNIATNIDSLAKQIDSGELNLGLVANLKNKIRNKIGLSTQESQNLASLDATLQKLRNDSLRLNKGTQTEGDAIRAWDELVNNINDPKVVKQRLTEISRLNQNAVDFQKKQVDMIRMNYGHEPIDTSQFTTQPASVGADKEKEWTARTPEDVKVLYKSGQIDKATATTILKDMESKGKF